MQRRTFLLTTGAASLLSPLHAEGCGFDICRTEAEWRNRLSETEYLVLREEQTERAYTSPLTSETRTAFTNAAAVICPSTVPMQNLTAGTGWPSFFESLPGAIGTKEDRKFVFQVRTEVHCQRCGSHLGHIFDDGPEPTGQRHCLNGLSLTFVPET